MPRACALTCLHAQTISDEVLTSIQVEEVRGIPRSANGKMRSVVNLCGDLLPSALQYGKLQI